MTEQPVTPSPLAVAKARRSFYESERSRKRFGELLGHPVISYNPQEELRQIGRMATYHEKLIRSRGNKVIMEAIALNMSYEQVGEGLEQYVEMDNALNTFAPKIARQSAETVVDSLLLPAIPENIDDYVKELNEAEKLSRGKKVDITQIYEIEDLYGELIRIVYKPETIANRFVSSANNMSHQAGELMMLSMVRAIILANLEKQGVTNFLPEVEVGELLGKQLEEIREQPDLQNRVRTLVSTYKRVLHIRAGEEVQRFWGLDAISLLPKQLQDGINYFTQES